MGCSGTLYIEEDRELTEYYIYTEEIVTRKRRYLIPAFDPQNALERFDNPRNAGVYEGEIEQEYSTSEVVTGLVRKSGF